MAKGSDGVGSSNKVVTLIINTKQRMTNLFLTFMSLSVLTGVIAWNSMTTNRGNPINVELLACFIGLLLLVLPLSEHWAYRPWQDAPQKIEHETCD